MIERSVLLQEIDSLSPRYYGDVLDFVAFIKERKVKETLSLEKAAEMAAKEYRSSNDLTAFCTIDGEDFYETR